MIIGCINFTIFFSAAFVLGFLLWILLDGKNATYSAVTADLIVTGGIMLLTVYAQCFSLFYSVGLLASGMLLLAEMIIIILCRRRISSYIVVQIILAKKYIERYFVRFIFCGLVFLYFLLLASSTPYSADDYEYHIQALEWIERYGVVKGLGNVHTRYAYNSAFLCLQALFSWSDVPGVGQSLHFVNGFCQILFLSYSILTLHVKKEEPIHTSDLLKIISIYICLESCREWSCLSTDALCIMFVLYIFTKWFETIEKDKENMTFFGYLSVLAVFAVTLKISAGMMVLLTLYPLAKLWREHCWKLIGCFSFLCFAVVIPFLVRNIIISGWLIYPVPELDFFDVPWKIPIELAINERGAIASFARTTFAFREQFSYEELYRQYLWEWFPHWFRNGVGTLGRMLFCLTGFSILIIGGKVMVRLIQREAGIVEFTEIVAIISFGFWFLQAPLYRFGQEYMWILVAILFGCYFHVGYQIAFPLMVFSIFQIQLLLSIDTSNINIIHQSNYRNCDMNIHELVTDTGKTVTMYSPAHEDLAQGYDAFPSVWDVKVLEHLRLFGDSFGDGFYYGK